MPAADPRPSLRLRAVRTPGRMAPSGKQVGQLGLVAAAFLAGRWTHSSGAGSPPQAALSDVAPEERHLLYTPPAGHGAVEVSLTLTRSLTVARNPIPNPDPNPVPHPHPNPNQVSTTTSSVLRDARGEIHNLKIGAARFNVLASRAGAMRSGDVHRSRQLDLVFRGLLTLTLTLTLTLPLTLNLTLTLAFALALPRSSVVCVRSPPARPGAMCGGP